MRVALQLGVGAIFSALLLVVPAQHATSWLGVSLDAVAWLLIALPFLVLLATPVGAPLWVSLYAWPVSHLPSLIAIPSLSDRALYTGTTGFIALSAIAIVGVAWFFVILWPRARGADAPPVLARRWPHPLVLLAHALGLGIFVTFTAVATASAATDPISANVIIVVGVVVAFVAAGRWVAADLGDLLFEPAAAARYRSRLLIRRRVSRRTTTLTFAAAALSALLLLAWYLSGPP